MPKHLSSEPIFDLQAHRGGRDARPENTLFAFAYAMELGVHTWEMDLHLTRDRQVVVTHNPTLDPNLTRGPDGVFVTLDDLDIRTMTLEEIRRFDVGVMNPNAGDYYLSHGQTQVPCPGARIPTLEEVFELAAAYGNQQIRFNLEIKSYADPLDAAYRHSPSPKFFTEVIYALIDRYRVKKRVIWQSFDWRLIRQMKAVAPDIFCTALSCEQPAWGRGGCTLWLDQTMPSPWLAGLAIHDFAGNYVRAAKAMGADGTSPYWEELTPELIHEAHALGLRVVPWTVNDPAAMDRLMEWGVDGIITDRPWILRERMQARGLVLPVGTVNRESPFHTGTGIRESDRERPSSPSDSAH